MPTLYFDTATTRFHTDQRTGERPHLMRLAWALDDEAPHSLLVRPSEAATIDPNTSAWHGITHADTLAHGLPIGHVMTMFVAAATNADRLLSFNAEFHRKQLARAMDDARVPMLTQTEIRGLGDICLMRVCAPLCKIPGKRPGGEYKYPSLIEAFRHATGTPLVMPADVVARGIAIVEAIRTVHGIVRQHPEI
ncbi:MAG TPA: hypothetical protein PLB88_10385 [Thermoanaerobaculaceae bacterium]|nr:hypothetical protein [Thermoanaerobaculaceae bacterium]